MPPKMPLLYSAADLYALQGFPEPPEWPAPTWCWMHASPDCAAFSRPARPVLQADADGVYVPKEFEGWGPDGARLSPTTHARIRRGLIKLGYDVE